MRLTDNRYMQERQSLEVALRMIKHEARTCTIRSCTGLSEDRVRKLYKSYVEGHEATPNVRRRRGKSPRQIEGLLRNSQTQFQASLLTGIFATLGLLERFDATRIDVALSARLCDAYDVYFELLAYQPLSFEHAWFLWRELQSGDELQLRACSQCEGIILYDRFSIATRPCPWCNTKESMSAHSFVA